MKGDRFLIEVTEGTIREGIYQEVNSYRMASWMAPRTRRRVIKGSTPGVGFVQGFWGCFFHFYQCEVHFGLSGASLDLVFKLQDVRWYPCLIPCQRFLLVLEARLLVNSFDHSPLLYEGALQTRALVRSTLQRLKEPFIQPSFRRLFGVFITNLASVFDVTAWSRCEYYGETASAPRFFFFICPHFVSKVTSQV